MDTIADLVRGASPALAASFEDTPIPPAFRLAFFGPEPITTELVHYPRLETPDERIAILAGPGALQFAEGLHAFADHVSAPVANTWGAKGIYPWSDAHHMGTCGLQAHDFELLGFREFDLVVTTGLDPDEVDPERYALTEVLDIKAKFLATLPEYAPARDYAIEPNALYERLAAVAQPGYVDDRSPRHPARAVMDAKQAFGPDEVVVAQPGPAGLWVGRTFPTDGPGTVFVPPIAVDGIAAALGYAAAGAGRSATVIADHLDAPTRELLDLARQHDLPVRVEDWSETVDFSLTEELVAAAGPVVAWTRPPAHRTA